MMNHEMLIDFGLSDFQTTSNLKDLGWISRSVARCWLWISQHWHSHQIRHRYHRWCPLVITHGNFGNGKHNYFSMIYLFQSYFKMMIYQYLVRHPHHPLFGHLLRGPSHGTCRCCHGTSIWPCCAWLSFYRFHHRFIGADVRAVAGKMLAVHGCGMLFKTGAATKFVTFSPPEPWIWDVGNRAFSNLSCSFRYQGAIMILCPAPPTMDQSSIIVVKFLPFSAMSNRGRIVQNGQTLPLSSKPGGSYKSLEIKFRVLLYNLNIAFISYKPDGIHLQ